MNSTITNIDNPKIKYYRSLTQKKYRDGEGKYLIEGVRFVEEAVNDLKVSSQIEMIIYIDEILTSDRNKNIIAKAIESGIKTLCVNSKVLKSLAQTETPQGIIAVMKQQEINLHSLELKDNPIILVVDGVQDPGNLGTIIRTAHAAGVEAVFLTKGTVDLYNSKVLRSTMGSIFKTKIIKGLNNSEIISYLKEKGISIIVADIKESYKYYELDYNVPVALVVGNEATGPDEEFLESAEKRVIVPMPGGAESLNVAIATGILVFEAVRQRYKLETT